MSRLTKRNSDGSIGISQCKYYNFNDFQKIVEKLAEYEDLEEQGLLLKLPCKVGDEIYEVDNDYMFDEPARIYRDYVVGIGIDKDGFLITTDESVLPEWNRPNKNGMCILNIEEAEQELKRVKNNRPTKEQVELISRMNYICKEKFLAYYERTKEEASDYINRNIDEYKSLSNKK